jgi:hypothetical protein
MSDAGGYAKPRFKLTAFDDLRVDTRPRYLVKDWISKNALIVAWGPPKSGKSFWVFDIAAHIAIGRDYRGHRVKQGVVVYIVAEGKAGIGARAEAWRQRNLAESADAVPLYVLLRRLDLQTEGGMLISDIRAQLVSEAPALVVIDTLNRTFSGSESSDEDMTAYIRAADEIKDAFECAVIVVHHSGIDTSRLRGHSALKGALDIEIEIQKDTSGIVSATVAIAKDMADGMSNSSRLDIVEVGTDEEGDPITSCVVVPTDETAQARERKPRLSAANTLALQSLYQAINEAGEEAPASNHVPSGARGISIELWRKYAYARNGEGSPEARKKGFKRAREALQSQGLIGVWNDWVWAVSAAS